MSEIGAKLREIRKKENVSLRDVERLTGVNSGYLSQLERGEVVQPKPAVLHKIAKGYGVPFAQLMRWAGYIEDDAEELTTNQRIALKTLGDPTDEEVRALREILNVMRGTKRRAFAALHLPDTPLDRDDAEEIRRYAMSLLKEAGALGQRPTPLTDIQQAAGLVAAGQITLSPEDHSNLVARFGGWVNRALKRLLGSVDLRSKEVWVKEDLHPMQERFVIAHEIGHTILPWQHHSFAYLDDQERLRPDISADYEREANYAAAEILFQGDQLRKEADSSKLSISTIMELGDSFGASIVASARRIAESSRRECAVAIAWRRQDGVLARTHLFTSTSFEDRFRWRSGLMPTEEIRAALRAASSWPRSSEFVVEDARSTPRVVRAESMFTGYASVAIFVPEKPHQRLLAGADLREFKGA